MIIALQALIFFRESLFTIFNRWIEPYYRRFALVKVSNGEDSEEEEDVHVYSDYDDVKGVVFFPPVYAQRYAAVSDCLLDERWNGKIEKVVDLGYNDISFIKYLKEIPGVKQILGVDLECIPLKCSSGLFEGQDFLPKRENPLRVMLFQGNAADPDYRLIGCDAVVAIEMIEHMLPHDLEKLVHTVFGFIKPWVAIFTTPNGDFNVLFKSLEANGLRRLDHFFEWSREQFHDWCSNIVNRYPEYTVNCRGIGPGPPDTKHLGCCSQMAVFVCSDYHKQIDLDPQSMAMITSPKVDNLVVAANWDNHSSSSEKKLLCNNDLYPDLVSEKASTIYLSTTSLFQLPPLEFRDSMAQCNLDKEIAMSFLMFDRDIETYQEETYHILVPRRKVHNKVYFIEDVASRLNCTTFQVKKFSKTTQNLMAMNKIDSLAHTREVVGEIKQLTNMLNFQHLAIKSKEERIWNNTNWGDNAPYWNQYYKVVRDYSYPFEAKSDECRILELISDEINRLIDIQYDSLYGVNINKMEIPISHLMEVVQHITDDQDKVKDLLEWNGYEIVGDVVVHSRMVLDNLSSGSCDDVWREDDTLSDWDTNLKTTSISDETSTVQELPGRTLRRALDFKVRKLRSLITSDEDITYELDKVVCRLMKLSLRTSRGRRDPPPTKWMQCKLLDLLTLTEKAVERRRGHINEFPIKAITYDAPKFVDGGKEPNIGSAWPRLQHIRNCSGTERDSEDTLSVLNKIKEDNTGLDLVRKYSHLVQQKPDLTEGGYFPMEIDDITVYSNDKDFVVLDHSKMVQPTKIKLERTQAWVEEELQVVKYPIHKKKDRPLNSTDRVSYNEYKANKQSKHHPRLPKSNPNNLTMDVHKNISTRQTFKPDDNTKYPKKVLCMKSSSYLRCNIRKYPRRREIKEHKHLQSTLSKPIPGSLIELCTPDNLQVNKTTDKTTPLCSHILKKQEEVVVAQMTENSINNEESYLGDIVMDGDGETSLLHGVSHHTTWTDVETDKKQSEKDTVLGSVLNAFNESSQENQDSQTIFLYDINEPSTSKGLRHVCMDAQCGPDDDAECLAPSTSPLDLSASIDDKTKHSLSIMLVDSKKSNVGSINENQSSSLLPRTKSIGIKIKDSDTQINLKEEATELNETEETVVSSILETNIENVDSSILTSQNVGQAMYPKEPQNLLSVAENKECAKVCSKDIDIASIIISRLKLCYAGLHVQSFKGDQNLKFFASHEKIQKPTSRFNSVKKPLCDVSVQKIQQKRRVLSKSLNSSKVPQHQISNIASSVPSKNTPSTSEKMHEDIRATKKTQIRNPKLTIVKKRSGTRNNISQSGTEARNPFLYRNVSNTCNIKKVPPKHVFRSNLPQNSPENIKTISYVDTNSKNSTKKLPKRYLPTYLRRRLGITKCTDQDINKHQNKTRMSQMGMDKTENLSIVPAKHLSQFLVYRNETRKPTKEEESSDRSISPVSVASSTCSSPTSVVTIKVRPCSNPTLNNAIGSKSATSIKSKKSTKGRTTNNKEDKDDKENDPSILCAENAYVAASPTVFITKLTNTPLHSTENTLTKQRKPVMLDMESAVEKQSSIEIMKKKSTKSTTEEIEESKNVKSVETSLNSVMEYDMNNMKHDWDEFPGEYPRTSAPVREIESKELNNRLLSDLLELNDEPSCGSLTPVFMRELIIDMLKMIDSTSIIPLDLDSKSVILSSEDFQEEIFEDNSLTIESTQTVEDTLQNIMECDEQEGDNTCDTVVANDNTGDLTLTDIEVPSFQTCTTTNLSNTLKSVEDNDVDEFKAQGSQSNLDPSASSVLDLFERKEILPYPPNVGPLAIQAFSGFSVNNPPAMGDQPPDYINLFDSETGSPAMGVSRQAESEEMLVSGRSSVTYVSCSMNEDTTVPDWLFRIINQPHNVQDGDLAVLDVPLPDPHYDANGNVVDSVVGTDAGAGDGRGVHSDLSQDSSGQGSSLSTSDASSGPLSEAVLINPPMLTGQFGIPPPIPLSFDSAESSPMDLTESGESDVVARSSREVHHETGGPLLGASDVDADESSLDTDAD